MEESEMLHAHMSDSPTLPMAGACSALTRCTTSVPVGPLHAISSLIKAPHFIMWRDPTWHVHMSGGFHTNESNETLMKEGNLLLPLGSYLCPCKAPFLSDKHAHWKLIFSFTKPFLPFCYEQNPEQVRFIKISLKLVSLKSTWVHWFHILLKAH